MKGKQVMVRNEAGTWFNVGRWQFYWPNWEFWGYGVRPSLKKVRNFS